MIAASLERKGQNDTDERIVRVANVRKARCRPAAAAQRSDCNEVPRCHTAASEPTARPSPIEICCNELASTTSDTRRLLSTAVVGSHLRHHTARRVRPH